MKINLTERTSKIARSLAIIGGTGAIVIGATFAATNTGTASLTGNTFSVGNASGTGLQIASDSNGTFGTTLTGFDFGDLTPGGAGSTHEHFFLKNTTTGAITLTAAATSVTANNLDTSKVQVHIEKNGTTDENVASLQSLQNSTETLSNPPAAGGTNEYDIWVTLDTGALSSGSSATANFGLDFTGSTQ